MVRYLLLLGSYLNCSRLKTQACSFTGHTLSGNFVFIINYFRLELFLAVADWSCLKLEITYQHDTENLTRRTTLFCRDLFYCVLLWLETLQVVVKWSFGSYGYLILVKISYATVTPNKILKRSLEQKIFSCLFVAKIEKRESYLEKFPLVALATILVYHYVPIGNSLPRNFWISNFYFYQKCLCW